MLGLSYSLISASVIEIKKGRPSPPRSHAELAQVRPSSFTEEKLGLEAIYRDNLKLIFSLLSRCASSLTQSTRSGTISTPTESTTQPAPSPPPPPARPELLLRRPEGPRPTLPPRRSRPPTAASNPTPVRRPARGCPTTTTARRATNMWSRSQPRNHLPRSSASSQKQSPTT